MHVFRLHVFSAKQDAFGSISGMLSVEKQSV
jgi:hypothetical protein